MEFIRVLFRSGVGIVVGVGVVVVGVVVVGVVVVGVVVVGVVVVGGKTSLTRISSSARSEKAEPPRVMTKMN